MTTDLNQQLIDLLTDIRDELRILRSERLVGSEEFTNIWFNTASFNYRTNVLYALGGHSLDLARRSSDEVFARIRQEKEEHIENLKEWGEYEDGDFEDDPY